MRHEYYFFSESVDREIILDDQKTHFEQEKKMENFKSHLDRKIERVNNPLEPNPEDTLVCT